MKSFDEWFNEDENEGNNELKQECENLLQSSCYDDDTISDKEKELWYYSEQELNELKANLLMNQVDKIENGMRYSQTDIKRKLRQL